MYRDSHPGATSSRGTRPSGGTSNRDAWRVGTWPTPVREPDSGDRYRNRRTYEDDRRWNGTYDEHRRKERRKENRYHHRRDRHRYYYGSYRHHYYCGHYWGGYYGWCSYRWYWPWWPTVYVESNRYNDDVWGALDLDVRPEKAEIYLDGQYIGIADEYDGFPSYLWLEKGTYDLAIYAEGYETLFRQVSIYPGIVIDIEDRMRTGPSTHPDDYGPTSTERRDARIARNREKEEAARAQEATAGEAWSSSSPTVAADADVGRLYVSVLPADAAIYLDGHFLGTAAEIGQLSAGIVVEPGDHVIELVRPGYETHRKEIVVPPGERTTVELELDRN
ncbi:MAG: PEGA domain-containing protein [Thermoanaerobaculia bacterium]|nr:PEGA domain-containing protein [Thermoanaerobaculia bacterium]